MLREWKKNHEDTIRIQVSGFANPGQGVITKHNTCETVRPERNFGDSRTLFVDPDSAI